MSTKVQAADIDQIIALIARCNVRQLDRLDDVIRREKMRKLGNGKTPVPLTGGATSATVTRATLDKITLT